MPTSVINQEVNRIFKAHELPGGIPVTHDAESDTFHLLQSAAGLVKVAQYVWDTGTLAWIKQTGTGGGPASDVNVLNFPAVQPVSDGGGSLTVDGPLTNLELRFSPVAVSGTVTAAGTVTSSQHANSFNTLGQKNMAGSTPVVLASDQSAIPVTITKTALTGNSPTSATVGTSSASVLAANTNRRGLVLTNLSVNNISFGLGVAAVLGSGITIVPNGVWVMDEYTFSTQQIFAIAGGASSALAIQEFQ